MDRWTWDGRTASTLTDLFRSWIRETGGGWLRLTHHGTFYTAEEA